jgi:hypothetical protein
MNRSTEIKQLIEETDSYRPERYDADHEVVLFSPEKLSMLAECGEIEALTHTPQLDLRFDLNKALSDFTQVQKRIIFKVYVQGIPIEVACKQSHKSSSWWTYWLREKALPKLRQRLKDYYVNGKVIV